MRRVSVMAAPCLIFGPGVLIRALPFVETRWVLLATAIGRGEVQPTTSLSSALGGYIETSIHKGGVVRLRHSRSNLQSIEFELWITLLRGTPLGRPLFGPLIL